MNKCSVSIAALQAALFPVEVIVSITSPPFLSEAEGVYVGVKVFPFVNVPDPPVDHVTPVELTPFVVPVKFTVGVFAQMVVIVPASTTGPGNIVKVTLLVAAVQTPLFIVVKVSVTVPAVISPAEGMYKAFNV